MVISTILSSTTPEELPWDSVWQYVLGDEETPKASNNNKNARPQRHIDEQAPTGMADMDPPSSFNTADTITPVSPTMASQRRWRQSGGSTEQSQKLLEFQQRDAESSARHFSPTSTFRISPAKQSLQREQETSSLPSTAISVKSSGSNGSSQRQRNDRHQSSTNLKTNSSISARSSRSSSSPGRQRSGGSLGSRSSRGDPDASSSNENRKIGFWRRKDSTKETSEISTSTRHLESCAKREWRTSYLRSSNSSSPRDNSHVASNRDRQSFVAAAGLEPVEAVIEQRQSGSPDTTVESENSETPFLGLFMCNGDDHSSAQSSAGCGTEGESFPSNASTPQQSVVREGAPTSWGFLDATSSQLASSQGSSNNHQTISQSIKNTHKQSWRSHGSSHSRHGPPSKTSPSSSSGIRILDTIASGIEDFLEPNFDAKTSSDSSHSSENSRASSSRSAPRRRGRRPGSMTITSLKYSHGDRSTTLSPITEGGSAETDDSSKSGEEEDENGIKNRDDAKEQQFHYVASPVDSDKGVKASQNITLNERKDASGITENDNAPRASAFVPASGAFSNPAEKYFRGLRHTDDPFSGEDRLMLGGQPIAASYRSVKSAGTSFSLTKPAEGINGAAIVSSSHTNEETSKLVASLSNSSDRAWNVESDNHTELLQQSMLVRQRKQQDHLNRSCVPARLNTCFSNRNQRTFLPVHTFASTDAGDYKPVESHELSAKETFDLFPKTRVPIRKCSRILSGPLEDATVEEIADVYLQEQGEGLSLSSRTAEIHALFEYEYECGPHMSVSYEEFGVKPHPGMMKVIIHESPPEKIEEGLVEYNKVVLKVEASTISQTDVSIREGKWDGEIFMSLPATPGADVVGKIFRIDNESCRRFGLDIGDRVMSLVKYGGNSRYLTVDPSKLVKISEGVDPAEAVCLAETYLHAFQLIHFGQSKISRYRPKALQSKTIFVIGDMTCNLGRAIATLAFQAGCSNLFGTAKDKHFETVSAMGVTPLEADPSTWPEGLNASVDLLVHLAGRLSPSVASKMLCPTGSMVISTTYGAGTSPPSHPRHLACSRTKASLEARVSHYNVFKAWDSGDEYIQQDLQHLVSLLENEEVVPNILDRISLSKVGKAHELLATRRHSGFIVCEPWLVSKSRTLNL